MSRITTLQLNVPTVIFGVTNRNYINRNQYKCYQENPDETFLCLKCVEEEIPFTKLNDNEF